MSQSLVSEVPRPVGCYQAPNRPVSSARSHNVDGKMAPEPNPGPGTERFFFSMAKNIYVGNLAWGVTNEDLLELFGQHGKVLQAQVISDRETGRSRGFGFVEMENDQEAENAIQALNGAMHNNRPLTVNVAKPPRRPRPPHRRRRWWWWRLRRPGRSGGRRVGGGGFGGTDRGRRY